MSEYSVCSAAHFSRNSPQWAISDLFGTVTTVLHCQHSSWNSRTIIIQMLLLMELASNKFSQSFKFIMPNNKFMQPLGQSKKLHYVFASPTLALFIESEWVEICRKWRVNRRAVFGVVHWCTLSVSHTGSPHNPDWLTEESNVTIGNIMEETSKKHGFPLSWLGHASASAPANVVPFVLPSHSSSFIPNFALPILKP